MTKARFRFFRQVTIGFYLILPYTALICVGLIGAEASGLFYLTGWITTFIFQIFFLAVNQSEDWVHSPLYRNIWVLIAPAMVLLRQTLYGGGLMQYFIELFIVEVLVLNLAVTVVFLTKIKEDIGMALFAFMLFGGFLVASFWGLLQNWLMLNPTLTLISLSPLLLALCSASFQHVKFLLVVAKGDVVLTDAEFSNPILFFVGQIVLWFGLVIWAMV